MDKNKRIIRIDGRRAAMAIGLLAATALLASPAQAFEPAANKITEATCNAFQAARNVLITAAVLSLIVGLAPMLWGQIKAKWLISCLVACTLFSVLPQMVLAFAIAGKTCTAAS